MKTLMLSAALALLCAGPAAAGCDYNRCGDPNMNYRFNHMLGIIMENALRPPYRPPLPAYMPPEYYSPPPQQRPLSREEWRQSLINEGNRFCTTYPDDSHCQHPKE